MNLFQGLKIDKNRPHHYLISVATKPMTSAEEAGKRFLKHGPLHFHNDHVDILRNALLLSKDEIFKTTLEEALELYKIGWLVNSIGGMRLAAAANQATLHHFSSDELLDDNYFIKLIGLTNISKYSRGLLNESKV